MANKNQKANDALLMAILQAYQGNPQGLAAATAAMAMSDIKRDGADQGDIHNIAANSVLDQVGDIDSKVELIFDQHPEIEQALDKYLNDSKLVFGSLPELIQSYLQEKRKYAEGGQFEEIDGFVDIDINGITYHLLHLVTEEQKERGLMDVEELDEHEGALFDYSDEPQAEISFWMKDTTIPLLICFVNENGKVISTHQGTPMSEEPITESSEFIAYVIEVDVNENIHSGDQTPLGMKEEIDEDEEDENGEDEHPELGINKLYVYGSDGDVQAVLQGGERIFSRKSTKVIIRKAKKAYLSKDNKDYKSLGKYIFKEMDAQDNRDPEYVEN